MLALVNGLCGSHNHSCSRHLVVPIGMPVSASRSIMFHSACARVVTMCDMGVTGIVGTAVVEHA